LQRSVDVFDDCLLMLIALASASDTHLEDQWRKRQSTGETTMFSMNNELRAFTRNSAACGSTRQRLGAALRASVLALACTAVAGPAFAASPYDGSWSVVISTQGGACQPTVRYGVQIDNGRVSAGGGDEGTVQGRVTPAGSVTVSVQSGGSWASGSGHLSRTRGGGVWQGQGSSGACEGTWLAERTGYQAQAAGSNGPLYSYAPGAIGPGNQQLGNSAASCAVRFRSYDPATGTYLGFDGLRHPCR
jgi:hypothetical protein